VTLTGDTSETDCSTFVLGKPVTLTFHAAGLTAGASLTLNLSIEDENARRVAAMAVPVKADGAGNWDNRVDAPHDKLGFYRVYASLSNGVKLQAAGSRGEGFLTYAVVPDPAGRKDYGEFGSRFGMQGGFGPWADKVLALIGARWVLESPLEWKRQEPDRAGQFGPEQEAQYVRERPAGTPAWRQYAIPTLLSAPSWAVKPETLAYMTGTLTPAGELAWADYCKRAARAFAQKFPDRKQHVYQITWEPIQPWGFKGTDADLIRIYEIAHRALHEADPLALVSGPTRGIYNNEDPQHTLDLLQHGLGAYLDGCTAHPYESITPEQDGMINAVRSVKAALHKATGRDIPLMGTEQGWSTDEEVSKELTQAQGLLRQNLIMLGEGFRFNFAFYIADYRMSGQKGYGYYYTLDPSVPFGPQRVAPRPIVPAYAAQSWLLDGSRSDGAIDWLGDRTWGYAFDRAGAMTLALWSYGPAPREVSIPTGAAHVQLYDWMGNPRTVETRAGDLKLTLGPEPVYVTGIASTIWGAGAHKRLSLNSHELQTYPGGSVAVSGTVSGPTSAVFHGSLRATSSLAGLPAAVEPVTAAGTQGKAFHLTLHAPGSLQPGAYPVRVSLIDRATGATVAETGITVTVGAPLDVQAKAACTGGIPAIAVALRSLHGERISGTVSVRLKEILPGAARPDLTMIDLVQDPGKTRDIPGAAKQAAFVTPVSGVADVQLVLPPSGISPSRTYQALISVATPGGLHEVQVVPMDFLGATRADALAPGTDEAGWSKIPAVPLTGPENLIRSPQYYPGPDKLSARLQFAWSPASLLIAADVHDDRFIQNYAGIETWRQDCIQLAFNLDPVGADAPHRRTSEIVLALTPQGPQAFRQLSYDAKVLPLGLLGASDIKVSIRRGDGGALRYEVAIPWTSLGMPPGTSPQPGAVIGVGATVNEVRSADQNDPCALGLYGGIYPSKDPEKLGTLVLEPAG
jgi:hypothetical protein